MGLQGEKSEELEFYRIKLLFHLDLEDRILISKLIQESYKEGFLNGFALNHSNTVIDENNLKPKV
jgi:hypothetical protein